MFQALINQCGKGIITVKMTIIRTRSNDTRNAFQNVCHNFLGWTIGNECRMNAIINITSLQMSVECACT